MVAAKAIERSATKQRARQEKPILEDVVRGEILPRLIVREMPLEAETPPVWSSREVADLAEFVLVHDATAIVAYLRAFARDAEFERICLELLAPAANVLGVMWEDDTRDFAEVTIGVGRLQSAMNALAAQHHGQAPDFRRRSALLATVPGETHGFGVAMLGCFFRRAGWAVTVRTGTTAPGLRTALSGACFDILILSIGGERAAAGVATLVTALRRASRNDQLGIMIGGPYYATRAAQAIEAGADATAADARSAIWQAENLLAARAHRVPA